MLKQELYNLQFDINKLIDLNIPKIDQLRNKVKDRLPLYKVLSSEFESSLINEISEIAKKITNNFTDIIVISMGGANLNPAMLLSALPRSSGVKFHFLSSTDPVYVRTKIASLDLKKTAILTISKSGNTLETISILAAIINLYDQNNISKDGHYFFITKRGDCKLFDIANALGGIIIPHDQEISGRYSGLSSVTMLPMLIAGIDVNEYLEGAIIELERFIKNNDAESIQAAIAMYNLNKNIHVNVIYNDKLQQFANWKSQIIAESLGKHGLGYTPIASKGPEDQHSMYQLYLDGPDDKFYSYFSIKEAQGNSTDLSVDSTLAGLENLCGMSLSGIHQINENASFEALRKKGRMLRKLTMESLSTKNLGSLVAFSMIEVILLGEIMGVNPFNQDGVELIKTESRASVGA